jgi:HEAT repeat protein
MQIIPDERIQELATLLVWSDAAEDRVAAVNELKSARDSRAVPALITALTDTDKKVRNAAAHALGAIGRSAIPPLVELLSAPRWITRYRAAEALGFIRDPQTTPILIASLSDPEDHVRYMAAKALGTIGDSRAFEPLVVLLLDGNEFVRRSAARALARINGERAKIPLAQAIERETKDEMKSAIRDILQARYF